MRKLSIGVLAAVLVLGLSAVALAAGPVTHSASGTITAIDTTAKTVSVKTKAGSEVFAIGAKTELMSAGKAITLQDLKQGDSVEVTYTKSGSTLNATRIEIKAGDSMAEPEHQSPPPNSQSRR